MKKKKKSLDWCCNICECPRRLFATLPEVIAHYRKNHPDDGYGLWDIGGDLGDAFSNNAARRLHDALHEANGTLRAARAKADDYDLLAAKFNALVRAVRMGQDALDAYRDAHEKKEAARG